MPNNLNIHSYRSFPHYGITITFFAIQLSKLVSVKTLLLLDCIENLCYEEIVWRQLELAFFGALTPVGALFNFGRIFMDAFTFGAIIGSILSGAVVGAVPAICGAIKHKVGLAIGGFFACLGASLLLGLILSVPTCAVFLFLIFKEKKSTENNSASTKSSNNHFIDNNLKIK